MNHLSVDSQAVTQVPMIEELFAVVGGDDDERVVAVLFAPAGDQTTDFGVEVAQLVLIAVSQLQHLAGRWRGVGLGADIVANAPKDDVFASLGIWGECGVGVVGRVGVHVVNQDEWRRVLGCGWFESGDDIEGGVGGTGGTEV